MIECRLGVPRIGERRTALAVGHDNGNSDPAIPANSTESEGRISP